jgi:zinc protease
MFRKFFSTAVMASLFLATASFSATAQKLDLSQQIPIDSTVTKGQLANGLTYYIKSNPKPEQKVELRLVVDAGSILENDDQQGLAHFMEHMNFNGLKHFPKNDLVHYLQKI